MKLYSTLRHLARIQFVNKPIKKGLPGVLKSRNFSVTTYLHQQYDQKTHWGTNKKHRKVKLNVYFDTMADPQIEQILAPLRASVKEQVTKIIGDNCSEYFVLIITNLF